MLDMNDPFIRIAAEKGTLNVQKPDYLRTLPSPGSSAYNRMSDEQKAAVEAERRRRTNAGNWAAKNRGSGKKNPYATEDVTWSSGFEDGYDFEFLPGYNPQFYADQNERLGFGGEGMLTSQEVSTQGGGRQELQRRGGGVSTQPVGAPVSVRSAGGSSSLPTGVSGRFGGLMDASQTQRGLVGIGGNTEREWNQNKNYIVDQVNAGTATAEQQQWYNDWVSAGMPSSQAEMNAWRQQQEMVSTQPVGEAIPVGNVSPTEASLNANFIAFLESLGLGSLVDLFTGGTGVSGGGQYTSPLPTYDPSAVAQDRTKVGYDPIRGAYNVPAVMQPGSAAYQAGLFNYIYPPAATPMAPLDPMEGITVPVITTAIQGM